MENKIFVLDNASHDIENRYDYLVAQYKEFLQTHSLEIYSHDSEPSTRLEIIESCNGGSLEKIIKVLQENRHLFNHWYPDEDFKRLLHGNRDAYLLLVGALVKGNRETLDKRIKDYHDSVEKLDKESIDVQSERTASAILTCYNPNEYAFYMDQVYKNLKDYLGYKITKKVGEQYSVYLEMLQPIVERIEKDKELSSKLYGSFKDYKPSVLQLAQEVCWTYFNEQQRKKYGLEKLSYTLENTNIKSMGSSLVTTYKKFLLKNHNMIFTGAPGTGKTYLAKQIAASIIGCEVKELKGNKQFGFVQFHPSYDYTDFVEGLRPSDKEGKEFDYRQGIFKAFCASALKTRKEYMEEYKDEDPDGKNAPKFIFIIDEINRGEISKIFGELFFSIDPGYRGDTGIVKTQYQNMVTDGPFMDGFYVPDNVYIIGTMNDIDRSVETLDFAFRRRFPSIEIKYADTLKSMADQLPDNVNKDEAKQHLDNLNAAIIKDENLGSEYCIGGAYLLKLKDVVGSYTDLWKYYIEPVIAEYFRGLPSQERKENIGKLRDAFIPKKNEDDK